MKIVLALIAQRSRSELFDPALHHYLTRLQPYATVESAAFKTEQSMLEAASRERGRTMAWLTLLDSRGEALTSEGFASWIGARRDSGLQTLFLAAGPASGWSECARSKAQTLLSLGAITLQHELARVVLAEQLFRAFTILAGHPYHLGH